MAKPKSSSLFHFTKNLVSLKGILTEGFFPRYSPEDTRWASAKIEFIAFPIVAFCDIPLGRIAEHIGFYGEFGIGMDKRWARLKGLNPVLYVAESSPLAYAIPQSVVAGVKIRDTTQDESYLKHARCVSAFSKPLSGRMIVNGKPISKEFYQESEWRYLARHHELKEYLLQVSFEDEKVFKTANDLAAEKATLSFTPNDVRYLFVKSDAEIPDLVDFINTKMDKFSASDLKMLLTRITSLETIERDI